MISIPGHENFVKIEPINKGWTNDKKYYIKASDGQQLLLRVTDISEYENKKAQYTRLEQLSIIDIPMSRPVDFGLCDDDKNVYQLLTWVDGVDVESVLPKMPITEQHSIGLKAGRLLKRIHSVPAPDNTEGWAAGFNRMLQQELDSFRSKPEFHCDLGEIVIEYFNKHNVIIGMRPQTVIHGDYNQGNLIIMPNGELGAIDFSCSYGDPWWEMFACGWRPYLFPHFFSGQIQGYFDDETTLEFWKEYTHYWAYGALIALKAPHWAGFNNLEEGKSIVRNILAWSDNLKNPIPSWYLDN